MENKQLQRQLKAIVQNLKGEEICRITQTLERDHGILLRKNFTKSGINCTCCTITHDRFTATGFGRNQQEAMINATKNYMETLIATNSFVPELRTAIRKRDSKPVQIIQQAKVLQPIPIHKNDDTLILSDERDLADISEIITSEPGCSCVYFQVHQHHIAEIKNMEARMKLIMKENEMLKELLLKDVKKESKNKENLAFRANFN